MGGMHFEQDKSLITQCTSAYLAHMPIIYLVTDEMRFVDMVIESQTMVELKRWRGENLDEIKAEPVPEELIPLYISEKNEKVKEEETGIQWKRNVYVNNGGSVIDPLAFIKKYPSIIAVKNYNIVMEYGAKENGGSSTERNIQRYVMQYLSAPKDSIVRHSVLILADPVLTLPKGLEDYVAVIEPESLKGWEIKKIIEEFALHQGEKLEKNYLEELSDRLKGFGRDKIESILTRIVYESGYLANNQKTISRPLYEKPEQVAFDIINQEKHQMLSKEGILEYEVVLQDPQIGGMSELMNYLEEKCHFVLNHRMEFKNRWNIDFPKGVIMIGIPGTGKSLSAKKIAKVMNLPLISLDMGSVTKSYLGESAANMRKALKLAESMAPCVLWIDEIEKAFAGMKGGGASDSASAEVFRCFAMLLKWMQEQGEPRRKGEDPPAPCFIFATSNNVSNIPSEFLRNGRFDKKFYVFMPTEEECIDIFKADMQNMDRVYDEQGNRVPLFTRNGIDDSFWHDIMDYCVSENQNGRKRKFLTGADIHTINQDAVRRMIYDRFGTGMTDYETLGAKERYQRLEYNFANRKQQHEPFEPSTYKKMLKCAIDQARPYGETNGNDIAECFLALYENKFNSVSKENQILIPFENFHEEREEVIDISEKEAVRLHRNSRYDQEMYKYIGGKINQIVIEQRKRRNGGWK